MTHATLIWHWEPAKDHAMARWRLTNIEGDTLASAYLPVSEDRWRAAIRYWRGMPERVLTPDSGGWRNPMSARAVVEKFMVAHAFAYTDRDEITFMTWEDDADDAKTKRRK